MYHDKNIYFKSQSDFDKEFPDLPNAVSSADSDYYKVKCDQYEYMIAVLRDMPEIGDEKLEKLGIPLSSQVSSPECVLLGLKYLIRESIKENKND